MSLKLTFPCVSIGLVAASNGIFLLGGMSNGIVIDDVFFLGIKSEYFRKVKNLKEPNRFAYNGCFINGKVLSILNTDGKLFKLNCEQFFI